MPTFITTLKFTPQGVTSFQDTCRRAADLAAKAKQMRCMVTGNYWTFGDFDAVVLFEAPDDETATALMVHLESLGNVRTQTVRAFTAAEMEKIVARMGAKP
jgi:uncharacterized protein with GYD domain